MIAAIIWSLHVAGVFEENIVNPGGWNLVYRFWLAALTPDFSPEFLRITFDATLKTLAYAVCGTFFSIILGLIVGILSSEIWWQVNLGNRVFWVITRAILATFRAIHELVWGLFFINIFGLDPLVAVMAIAIPFGAITAKVYSEILDETPPQALLALINSGVSPLNAFIYSLIPQAFPNLLAYGFYRFECSIRAAAVLGIIGAGGLGYQILLSLQSLEYQQMWTLLFALVVLSGSTDFWCGLLRHRLRVPSRLNLNVLNFTRQPLQSDWIVNFSAVAAIGLLIFSFWYINADYTKLWSARTMQLLLQLIPTVPPQPLALQQLLTLTTQTLAMSILAIALAGLAGILFSFPAAKNIPTISATNKLRSAWGILILLFTRFLLLFARAVPEPIWALIFLFVLFPGIVPGAIALAIHNFGILGRLMAEVIENLDERPLRSLSALGASNSQVFLYGVLPSTLPRFVAYILYRWEVCIRATIIVGFVGAGGLGRLLTEQLSSFDYQVLTTLIVFICLTLSVDLISATIRRSLR